METAPFDVSDAETVACWAADGDETRRWCNLDRVDADIVMGWAGADDVEAFALHDPASGLPVAYGEVWFDDDEGETELAHLIVAPAVRGQGVGRALVDALVARAHVRHPLAILRVVPDNDVAIRCYRSAGFRRATPEEEAAWNVGQTRAYVWMLRPR